MIQDIYPHRLDNQFNPSAAVSKEDTVLNIYNGRILVNMQAFEANQLVFPRCGDFAEMVQKETESAEGKFIYLFAVDKERYFLLQGQLSEECRPTGFDYVEDRAMRREGIGPDERLFAAVTGKHLSDWYRDTCFCGRCGKRMMHSAKERAMTCEACHYTAYPRIMPAVIVGVKNGDSLLLTKYKTGFGHNALIAGFTEIGETAEETVAREVMEEVGIKVKNIRYYKSQPWGTANDLLLGYYCELDGDPTITMDSNELKYAEWVKREDIVLQPGNFSLTNEMMKLFKMKDIATELKEDN